MTFAAMLRALLLSALVGWSATVCAVHFDVELRTSGGPVAGSRITTEFYGDLGLDGRLPIDAVTGYQIFPGYFGDLEGGPYLTDDPGFQAFSGTFARSEEIHFRAIGNLLYWNPSTGRWGPAASDVRIALYGGIPVEVVVGYTENPAAWEAQYNYYAAGTRFGAQGIEGPLTAVIDDASRSGAFHAHLDWKISRSSGGEPEVGAYMVTIALWSTAQVNGEAKYLPSQPIQVVFERGISEDQLRSAILARVEPPPPPACAAATLNWLVDGMACSADAAQTASGGQTVLEDTTEPNIGSARFSCSEGLWGAATQALCTRPALRACTGQTLRWSGQDSHLCEAAAPATEHDLRVTLYDAADPLVGAATFHCSNGSWSAAQTASCAVRQPRACSAQTLAWTVNGQACQAPTAAAISGAEAVLQDLQSPTYGTARFTCTDGLWQATANAQCGAMIEASSRGKVLPPWARPTGAPWKAP